DPVPEMRPRGARHAPWGEGVLEAVADAMVELAEALSARRPLPQLLHRALTCPGEELLDLVGRTPVPVGRVAYLPKPVHHLGFDTREFDDGFGRLASPDHRRDPDLV